jgi:hypothetical protein
MRNVLDRNFIENQNTFYFQYLFLEKRAIYQITSENMVEPEEQQMTSQYGAYEMHAG